MNAPQFMLNKKIALVFIGAMSGFFFIIMRLIYLQVYCGDYFLIRSQQNFIRHEIVNSPRGSIKDVHGNFLATNRPVTVVYWQGTGNYVLSSQQWELLRLFEDITGIVLTSGPLFDLIVQSERKNKKVELACDIDFSLLGKLSERIPLHENVVVEAHFKRFYPYGTCGSHIVGYLGNVRLLANGKSGLEKIFDADLSGKQGSLCNVVNSAGQKISHVELQKASIGNDVHTTIDIDIQMLCESVFPDEHVGSFLVLNPADGAIVALVSRPNFDPNAFLDPISIEKWREMQENNPFLNRAFDASYPSGSIFKLVTISAALEHGIIPRDSLWMCKGYTLFGKRKYWCARRCGHGEISIEKAVAVSCNAPFFEIGKKIDIDLLAEYAYKFGLGKKTNIIFPEKVGLIPSREWKLDYKGERWWSGETLSVTIGQSFLLVTPIQIARMIASIFTGYLISPRLLINEPIITTPLDIRAETITLLKDSMEAVVKEGTGRSMRRIKDVHIYAKTSTAQTSDFGKRKLDKKYLEHGWFAGYFHYKDYDPLVIVILVERVGTAQVATNIAKNFLVAYKKYKDCLS